MRSVPYTAEPVVVSGVFIHHSQIIIVSCVRSNHCKNILAIFALHITLSHPLVSSSITVKGSWFWCIVNIRHVVIAANNIQVIQLLEVLLGHVNLTQDDVLHLRPSHLSLATAVHVDVTEVNSNRYILSSILHNQQLDITITDNLTVLVNQVNTNQRLTTYSLLSSGCINHSVTVLVN